MNDAATVGARAGLFPAVVDRFLWPLGGPQRSPLGAALRITLAFQLIFWLLVAGVWLANVLTGHRLFAPPSSEPVDDPLPLIRFFWLLVRTSLLTPLIENTLMALFMALLRLCRASAFTQALWVAAVAGLAHAVLKEDAFTALGAFLATGALFFVMAWQLRTWEAQRSHGAGLWASMVFHGVWNGVVTGVVWGFVALHHV